MSHLMSGSTAHRSIPVILKELKSGMVDEIVEVDHRRMLFKTCELTQLIYLLYGEAPLTGHT
jgi:hypothetical protein